MLALIPLAAWSVERTHRDVADQTERRPLRARLAQVMPPFLVAFVMLAFVRTVGDARFAGTAHAETWSRAVAAALTTSDLLLVVGMTAVGLGVSLRDLRGLGWRAIAAAATVAGAVAACSLMLTRAWLT